MPRVAQQYLGPYRLLNLIRTGKTCQVWEAMRDSSQQRVALKVLVDDYLKDRDEIASMRNEYTVGKTLDHPRVIHVYDMDQDPTYCYMAMEMCQAPNIKQHIHQGVELLFPRLKRIVREASEGLAYFHSKGWIHRDIKPDNFLLPATGSVKLIDFALGQRARSGVWKLLPGGKSSAIQGTRSYMSPEQIRCAALDARADIYSFGCMLHELLGGKPPFTGSSTNDLLNKHLRSPPPSVQGANRNVTDACASLIKRMLAKDPKGRPASMDEALIEWNRIEIFKEPPPDSE